MISILKYIKRHGDNGLMKPNKQWSVRLSGK